MGDEHDIRNLNYVRLKRNLIRGSWRFFACCALYTMFAVFPRHVIAKPRSTASRSSSRNFFSHGGCARRQTRS